MMQHNLQSRWQSWMRMLAADIQSVHESALWTGSRRLGVSAWCHAPTDESTSLATERYFFCVRRLYENPD
jgi:hypothetical protein